MISWFILNNLQFSKLCCIRKVCCYNLILEFKIYTVDFFYKLSYNLPHKISTRKIYSRGLPRRLIRTIMINAPAKAGISS